MPTRALRENAIQHIEWTTRDPRRLKAFFGRVFDWKFDDAFPGYTMIRDVGGIFEATDPAMPIVITPYVNVADISETEARIRAAGGTVVKSREEVPGRGWFSIFSDPDGTLLGIFQASAARKRALAPRRGRRAGSTPRRGRSPRRRPAGTRKRS